MENRSVVLCLGVCFALSTLFPACKNGSNNFEVKDFVALTNYQTASDTLKIIELDYTEAIKEGFIIPTVRQVKDGLFEFKFQVKNNTRNDQKFYYKLFYQNETYKFPDNSPNSDENFYGSWEDTTLKFLPTEVIPADGEFHAVSSTLRIVGNPRNEKEYYGAANIAPLTQEDIDKQVNEIKATVEWLDAIKRKALDNNIEVDEQLKRDAIYTINMEREEKLANNRWKRNPRVGEYSFLLVVTSENEIATQRIPGYIQNFGLKKEGKYVNPYSFFSNQIGQGVSDTISALLSHTKLKVIAKPDLSKGIYVDREEYADGAYSKEAIDDNCNDNLSTFYSAHISQFIHKIDRSQTFQNIPVVADVTGGGFSKKEYDKTNSYSPGQLICVPISRTDCPCKTVQYDPASKGIVLKNPATKQGEWKKENVGIMTRHGFTYGKTRVKVKLPELLNKHGVWNGLTNAIWMVNNEKAEWNNRRECTGGYIPKDNPGEKTPRVKKTPYSEIDIEIVKANRNWPATSYPKGITRPENPSSDSDKVMVTYTNWDLACHEPKKFGIGVHHIDHAGIDHVLHRWDDWYQAVTGKYSAPDDELFKGPYFWFEIDWRPTEIIWRMGPEKDQMREIGYVNADVSAIPNNQMLLIITQEWHLANWWPEAPFDQNRIPFPKEDIVGKVLEIEIE